MPGVLLEEGHGHQVCAADKAPLMDEARDVIAPQQRRRRLVVVGVIAAAGGLLACAVSAAVAACRGAQTASSTASSDMASTLEHQWEAIRMLERRAMGNTEKVEASNVDAAVAKKGALGDNTTVTIQFQTKEELKAWTHVKFEELMIKKGISHKEWRVVEGRDGAGKALSSAPNLTKVTFPYYVAFLFKRREASALGSASAAPTAGSAAPVAAIAKDCPLQSTRMGDTGAGVAGCGLTDCSDRHAAKTVASCRDECTSLEGCTAFTWLPSDVKGRTVCSLYDTAKPELPAQQSQSSGQIMCKLQSCFEKRVQYRGVPVEGHARTEEPSVWACQARCRGATGCRHFAYWPDKSCDLEGAASKKAVIGADIVSGPASCDRCGIAC